MPLLDKMSIRVPVVTGFTSARKFNAVDSSLLSQTKQVVQFLHSNNFWNAQIGQVDITTNRKFELIPVIGYHVIKLGDGENVERKLNNLFVFYKQVMSKVGFNKYAALDIEFTNQVVAIKKEPTSPVDSIQLQKNIEELMNKANMQTIEEDMLPDQDLIAKSDSTVSITTQTNSVSSKTHPNPTTNLNQSNQNSAKAKTEAKPIPKQSESIEKQKQIVKNQVKENNEKVNSAKPKAVMPSVH